MSTSSLLLPAGRHCDASPRAAAMPPAWNCAERIAAAVGMVLLAPMASGVTIVIRLLAKKPPLVALRRVGKNGEPFWLLKFRTMWDQSPLPQTRGWIEYLEGAEVPARKCGMDPRVTSAFAAFCRRYSIDEWPQLAHVVTGKMRLAGPRPLTQLELDTYYGETASEIIAVPPGITGLWQVMGRSRLTYAQRKRLDLFFVRRFSPWLYLLVLLRTPDCVFRGRGAW